MRRLQPQNKTKKRKSHDLHCRGLQKRLDESECHGLIRARDWVPPPTACCRPIGERCLAPAAVLDGTINRPATSPAVPAAGIHRLGRAVAGLAMEQCMW